MELLRLLNSKCASAGIGFLVVGGHAVNAYGVSRQTGDLDLGVREKDESWWRRTLEELRYKVRYERKGFVLFSPPALGAWPVDLLCLNDKTFEGLVAQSRTVSFGDVSVKVPSVEHLIAMKLHALHENWADRELKDLEDIRQLVRRQHIEVESPAFEELCKRFGNEKIYERIKEICSRQ